MFLSQREKYLESLEDDLRTAAAEYYKFASNENGADKAFSSTVRIVTETAREVYEDGY